MQTKKVTGTIMLNKNNGEKSFLVQHCGDEYAFIRGEINSEMTSMAVILNELKNQATIDINLIDLVELVSIKIDDTRTPLFVFEMSEDNYHSVVHQVSDTYSWQNAVKLSEMLKELDLSEAPVFNDRK